MSQIDLLDKRWVDLVFEGRNQSYGAYQLRKDTGSRNAKALIAMFVTFLVAALAMVGMAAYDEMVKSRVENVEDVELSKLAQKQEAKVERKEKPKVEAPEQVVEKVKSSVKFTAPVIKKDEDVPEDQQMKSMDELAQSTTAIGVFDVKGNDEAEGEVLKAKEVIKTEEPKIEEQKVFDVVEQMPSFPGDDAALMQYLNSHIKYPAIAEENGVQGRVIVSFVVERDGSITDVKVLKSADPSLDKEAVRVTKSMPKWIPGKQNGSSVRVKYTLPVTFRLT